MTEPFVIEVPDGSDFSRDNLPLGIGAPAGERDRAWVAVGDHAIDLGTVQRAGLLEGLGLPDGCFADDDLHRFLRSGPGVWHATRRRLAELAREPVDAGWVRLRSDLEMSLPIRPVDFVDFYSSLHHATNLGRLFRPDDEPLLPNWRHLPVGYHGRTGTLVPTDSVIARPHGLRLVDDSPVFGPSAALDIELEVGTVVGVGSALGTPVAIEDAADHLYGMCLVNDWSARDVQSFEYQPLGPFLGKSFATSVGPWLVSFEALEPYRVASPVQDPPVSDYLRTNEPWGFDLHLEVWIETAAMRAAGEPPVRLSEVGFADMYWSPAQHVAHMTVNGASTSTGDLFASGTVSGPSPGSHGSLIEMTANGVAPIELPDGSTRCFLEDGDRIILRGWAGGGDRPRVGFGELTGTIDSGER
ncbi:MAG: fumarylacetoacetase [Acidimicrobiales bacterium]